MNSRLAGKYISIFIGLAIAFVTLMPSSEPIISPVPLMCIACGTYGGVDFLLNIIMFIPFGIGLYLFTGSWKKAVAICIVSTFAIELLQVDVVSNRDAGLSDVLANSIGSIIGATLAKYWRGLILPSQRQAKLLYMLSLICWAGIISLSAVLLKPTVTSHSWWAQVRPVLQGLDRFPGEINKVVINDREIDRGRIDDALDFKGRFGSADVSVVADVTFPVGYKDSTSNIAPITAIFDEAQKEIMMLGQNGRDLLFRSRTITSTFRLREPTFSLQGSFDEGLSSDRIERASRFGYEISLTSQASDEQAAVRAETYSLHPFLLWNAMLPFYMNITPAHIYLSMMWALGLMLIPGYWSARSIARAGSSSRPGSFDGAGLDDLLSLQGLSRSKPSGATRNEALFAITGVLLIVVAVLTLVPKILVMNPVPVWGWVATFVGYAVGFIAGMKSPNS